MKKLLIAAGLGFIAISALSNTKLGGYLAVWWDNVTKSAKEKVSMETELARIKKEVAKLDKDIEKAKGELAEANVNVRKMTKEVSDLTKAVSDNEAGIKQRGEVLKKADDKSQISWGAREVSHSEAKNLLLADVKRHNTLKDSLKAKQSLLSAYEQHRDACEANVNELVTQQTELTTLVADLEAEIKKNKVEQNRVKKPTDASGRLNDIKSSTEELRHKLEVQREKRRIDAGLTGAAASPAQNLTVDQILSGLQQPPAVETKVEVKVVEK